MDSLGRVSPTRSSTFPKNMGLLLVLFSVLGNMPTRPDPVEDDLSSARSFTKTDTHIPYLEYIASQMGRDLEEKDDKRNRKARKDLALIQALPYLTFQDLLRARLVRFSWNEAAPLTFNAGVGAFFMKLPQGDLYPTDSAPWGPPPQLSGRWQCPSCATWSACIKNKCVNPVCRQPQPKRLFVGQLRKEGTAALLRWITAMLLPSLHVTHIESHTNAKERHRGRGCAWLDVATEADRNSVLSLHGRVFVDAEMGKDGVWVGGTSQEARMFLRSFATSRLGDRNRGSHLPRTALVVEVPDSTPVKQSHAKVPLKMSDIVPPPPLPPTKCQCGCGQLIAAAHHNPWKNGGPPSNVFYNAPGEVAWGDGAWEVQSYGHSSASSLTFFDPNGYVHPRATN